MNPEDYEPFLLTNPRPLPTVKDPPSFADDPQDEQDESEYELLVRKVGM